MSILPRRPINRTLPSGHGLYDDPSCLAPVCGVKAASLGTYPDESPGVPDAAYHEPRRPYVPTEEEEDHWRRQREREDAYAAIDAALNPAWSQQEESEFSVRVGRPASSGGHDASPEW